MKEKLTLNYIKKLSLDRKPIGTDHKGGIVWGANPDRKSYIVWDSSREAPPGFGIRIASKKTYVIRRKVHGKSIMPTVGNFADYLDINDARKKAAEMARFMLETGQNPNEEARRLNASEITLGEAFEYYRSHLTDRGQPAAQNTLNSIDRAVNRFKAAGWLNRRVKEIVPDEVISLFKERQSQGPAANEQAFRWSITSINHLIKSERLAAESSKREPRITANPFEILVINKMFRTPAQVDEMRKENNKRNPLQPSSTLGPFLEAAWSKKNTNDNETGVHYLILMLLLGCRTAEHNQCAWGELLTEEEKRKQSHVWLQETGEYGSYIFIKDTKNRRSHRLPLGTMTKTLLEKRQISAAKEAASRGFDFNGRKWVFPARSKFSKTGYYKDATDLLSRLKDEIGVQRLTRHDLRRSFGTVLIALDVPEGIKSRFFNHANSTVTDTYTQAEWKLLREWMERVEQAILSKAPNVFNSLKPLEWPPLAAPDPHVCIPAKPRTGRPRKTEAIEGNVSE